jgi:hypothetical protein
VLLEFVRMSDAVHRDAGMWLSKCLIEFHRKPKRLHSGLCVVITFTGLCVQVIMVVYRFIFMRVLQSCEM